MNRKKFIKTAIYGAGAIVLSQLIDKNNIANALNNPYQTFLPIIQKNNVRYIDNSKSLAEALVDPTIQPGETLLMDDGVYTGDFISERLFGTEDQPIEIRPLNPGKVIIDGSLYFGNTAWVHFYDIEFKDSRPDRTFATIGIKGYFTGFGFYGCLIHDIHSDGVTWYGSGAGEIAECVFYNNGYRVADGSGHGHSIYSLNELGGLRKISRNIFHNNLGRYSIHIYSPDARNLRDYTCADNIIAGEPVHTGGGQGLKDFIYQRNIQYGKWCQLGRYGFSYLNERGLIQDNEYIDSAYSANMDCDYPWVDLVESGNKLYGGASFTAGYTPQNPAGYSFLSSPATKIWKNVFTKSTRWLGSIAIYNRDSAEYVSVDFSNFLTVGSYKLRNSQNMAETWNFNYIGTPINVPMRIWTAAQRIGDSIPNNGLPIFAAFVIERQ
jgi:hypothetical protein